MRDRFAVFLHDHPGFFAPAFADGTANTSRQLSKLPGGGIPSILHPNEAVIPLSRGRKVPVDLNLALTAPAPTNIDMSGVADALTMVADTQGRLANSLAQDTAVTIQNTWTGVGFSKPTGNAFVGSFGNPADLAPNPIILPIRQYLIRDEF